MLAKLNMYKCKASTIMEAIVAALILLIGFSLGMVIYNRVLQSSWSAVALRCGLEQQVLADSLSSAGEQRDQVIAKDGLRFEVSFKASEAYKGLQQMQIKALDPAGKTLSLLNRIIPMKDEK